MLGSLPTTTSTSTIFTSPSYRRSGESSVPRETTTTPVANQVARSHPCDNNYDCLNNKLPGLWSTSNEVVATGPVILQHLNGGRHLEFPLLLRATLATRHDPLPRRRHLCSVPSTVALRIFARNDIACNGRRQE